MKMPFVYLKMLKWYNYIYSEDTFHNYLKHMTNKEYVNNLK